ncbi:MAG: cupin domain-containing protein [Beijerinckiaceae bacterium]
MASSAAGKRKAGSRQVVVFSHARDGAFKTGLRSYAAYRDLGIAKATAGAAVAHVIRFVEPCSDEVRIWHTHDVEFQMIYVLKGWIVTEMEGHPPERMEIGSSWIQPPKIRHRVVDYEPGTEVLEVVLPADFETHMEG